MLEGKISMITGANSGIGAIMIKRQLPFGRLMSEQEFTDFVKSILLEF